MGKEILSKFGISVFSRTSATVNKYNNQNTTITKFTCYLAMLQNVTCYLVMLQNVTCYLVMLQKKNVKNYDIICTTLNFVRIIEHKVLRHFLQWSYSKQFKASVPN